MRRPRFRPFHGLLLAALLFTAAALRLRADDASPSAPAAPAAPALRWFKGNTHTHTLWSDGDAPPEVVVEWYKNHGYHFLVLSDHNVLATSTRWIRVGKQPKSRLSAEALAALIEHFGSAAVALIQNPSGELAMRLKTLPELRAAFETPAGFLLVTGEEITDHVGELPLHHNVVNQEGMIAPTGGATIREAMAATIAAVEAEAQRTGRPVLVHLNHPNYGWAVTPDDLAEVRGERFFEVYNGHREGGNAGDAQHPDTERMWDYVLSLRLGRMGGDPVFGLATDDAHNYQKAPPQVAAGPGRGWVWVQAEELSPDAITRALLAGRFYASSGVTLAAIEAAADALTVTVAAEPDVTYTTRFVGTRVVGEDGRGAVGEVGAVLQETAGATASYRFKGDELYVRAVVTSSRLHPNPYREGDRETAWVQPVVVRRARGR